MLFLLLLGVFLMAEALEDCFENLNTYQCSCIDQKGYTPFWTDHNKIHDNNWTANISVTDNKCSIQEALEFIIHDNTTSSPDRGPNEPSKPGSNDERIVDMISNGYVQHGESLYKLHYKQTYWDNARRICISEGSHLAIPNTDDEVKFLGNLMQHDKEQSFIGIYDILNEGEHVTIFGEPASVAFEKFDSLADIDNLKQPTLAGEDCITLDFNGYISDATCSHNYKFLCEFELDDYPPKRAIDYNNGPYKGIESSKGPAKGKDAPIAPDCDDTVIKTERCNKYGVTVQKNIERTVPSQGYEYYPGFGFYRFHTTPQTWETARLVCEEEDAHLAIINSIFEHSLLQKIFEIPLPKYPVGVDSANRAHIGFHDLFEEGRHVTLFNETLKEAGYSEWHEPRQPDNLRNDPRGSGENCGAIYEGGGMDDIYCEDILPYICEQELYE